jgi:phosphate starvation-inducible protein PhoH
MHELDTIITRIGHTSKFFLCGDYRQVDLTKKNDKSGLLEFLTILRTMKEFTEIEFSVADIVRSSLVKNYIIARINHEDNKNEHSH